MMLTDRDKPLPPPSAGFARAELPLPVVPGEVDAAWLSRALGQWHPGIEVTRATIEDVICGTSTKLRVRVDYNEAGQRARLPPTLIVKGGFEEHSPLMKDMYLNEVRFYRDLLPLLPIRTPHPYYAGSDPDSHQSIVIMEDLRLRDARFCSVLEPQRYEQVARRLSAMARYHAHTWNSAELAPGGKLDWIASRYEGFSTIYMQRYLRPEVWTQYMQLPRAAAVPKCFRDSEWMEGALQKLGEYHRCWPVCVVHGDTHLGNLYEEADGTPGFFDAQASRGPWQLEVAYHVAGALDWADRPRWEKPLLIHYLEALRREGISPPSFDEAFEAYRHELAYGYFIFIINESRFQTEAVNTAQAMRFAMAMLDHDTHGLLS